MEVVMFGIKTRQQMGAGKMVQGLVNCVAFIVRVYLLYSLSEAKHQASHSSS
jgi:hypothetical protein